MSVKDHQNAGPEEIWCRIITVSDTRDAQSDRSGPAIVKALEAQGHQVSGRVIVRDDLHAIQNALLDALGDEECDAVLLTGGTGIAARDITLEAVEPFLEVEIPGFGELFRMLSYQEIGPAAMLSRAFAGVSRGKLVAGLPGSPKAVSLAMEKLLAPELPHLVGQIQKEA